MLSLTDGKEIVQFTRHVIEQYVKYHETPASNLGESFHEKQGVFVTLHTYPDHDLRGCIGIPFPVMPLQDALIEAAQSATQDPRFPALKKQELDAVIIEITILTKPEIMKVKQPQDYLAQIDIGRDGLIVEQGFYTGLLLPQVPVEQHWDKEEFISHTCIKAELPPDAWFDTHTRISKFSGQIFTETQPKGPIKEKHLNGSDN
jgi:uncharacterized protein (TIGR00296 family)